MILGEMAKIRLINHSKNKNEGMYFKSSGQQLEQLDQLMFLDQI